MTRNRIWILIIVILIVVVIWLLVDLGSDNKPVVSDNEKKQSTSSLPVVTDKNKNDLSGEEKSGTETTKKDLSDEETSETEAATTEAATNKEEKDEKIAPKKDVKKEVRKFSSLTVTSVVYKNENLEIEGESDLPDNSVLLINVIPMGVNDSNDNDVASDSSSSEASDETKSASFDNGNNDSNEDNSSEDSLSSKTSLQNGKYRSVIKVPNNPKLYKGPYKIEVKFLLDMQTNVKVLNLIGDGAKNLAGKQVVLVPISHYKSLQYSEIKTIWDLELKAYSVAKPKGSLPGDVKYILASFFQEWVQQNWQGMLKYSYKPWAKDEKNPEALLKSLFGSKKLIGAKILSIQVSNPLMTEINYKIYYYTNSKDKQIKSEDGTVKMIKDDNDNWGVFPLSIIKKDAVYKMDLKV